MSKTHNGRTAVLGLGNPVLADDAAGLHVAAELQRRLRAQPVAGVDVLASTRAGFELIDLLRGYSRAVIVDSLDLPAPVAGRVRQLTIDDVSGSARLTNQHELGLAAAFELAAQLGEAMPLAVTIYAIEAGDVRSLGADLTPAVAAAVVELAKRLYTELAARAPAEDPPIDGELLARRAYYAPDGAWLADPRE
jgi:hydrogenase maturation protease